MRLIDQKIKNEDFIKTLGWVLRKYPSRIHRELNRWINRFNTQISYVEAIEKIEGKTYTIHDLFLKEIQGWNVKS